MKRIILLVTLGLILILNLEAKRVEGKILFKDDTIDVVFNIPVKLFTQEPIYEKLQYRVTYYDSAGKKFSLRPDDAKEIRFTYEYENVRMLSRINTLSIGNIFSSSTHIFLRLEIDGDLKLLTYYYTQSSPGMNTSTGAMTGGYHYSTDRYILQKGEGELKRPKVLTFRKDMASYFSDCPALVEKIESKDFRSDDLEMLVRFYNANCK